MNTIRLFSFTVLASLVIIGSSFAPLETRTVDSQWIDTCVLDIFAQNNTNTIVDYVQFESTLTSSTFYNLAANGGTGSGGGAFYFDIAEGAWVNVKLRAFPGTGSIRIYRGNLQTLVYCTNFTNSSSSLVYSTPFDIGDGQTCPEAFFVFVETNSCP